MVFKKNRKQHILAIAVGVIVTVPVLALPIGIRKGISPALAVTKAYNSIMGNDVVDEDDGEGQVEDWALVGEDEMIDISDGSLYGDGEVDPDKTETEVKASYTDIPKYTIYQVYDDDNLPQELLDPQYFAADNKTFYIKSRNSNLKESPDTESKTVTKLSMGEAVTRIGIGDTWSKIQRQDGTEGFILTTNISDEMVWVPVDRKAWVDTDSLKVRKEPNTSSDVLEVIHDETPVIVSAYADKWSKVKTKSGKVGYVYSSYLSYKAPPTPTPTNTPRPTQKKTSSSSKYTGKTGDTSKLPHISGKNGESVVSVAASMLGIRYVYGGASRSGIDCSGLVLYCYKQIGIKGIPHGANAICNHIGVSVARSDIKLGDVVCYDYGDHCGHVAIYAGGGRVIHASMSKGRVIYGNVDMMKIRRIKRIIR